MKNTVKRKMLLVAVVTVLAAGPVAAKETSKPSGSGVVEEISVIPAQIVIPEES